MHLPDGEVLLSSLFSTTLWEPDEIMEAQCLTGLHCRCSGESPSESVGAFCGISFYDTLEEARAYMSGGNINVFGKVLLWGKVAMTDLWVAGRLFHTQRAQYACISELYLPHSLIEPLTHYNVPMKEMS